MAIKKRVTVNKVSTIFPSLTKLPCVYSLSNFDLVNATIPTYMQVVYYFNAGTDANNVALLMESLREALIETLEIFPVLGGRLRNADGGRLEVLLNIGGGIPFYEATAAARLEEWPDLRDCSLETELNPENVMIGDFKCAPLARAQATVFKCGGVALGFSASHAVSDGKGATEFMKAWGEIYMRGNVSLQPYLDRSLLFARDPPIVTIPIPRHIASMQIPGESMDPFPSETDGTRSKIFCFQEHNINELMHEIEQGPYKYGRATSFETLSALLWLSVTKARKQEINCDTRYTFPVSARGGRWQPLLPEGYFGNAVINSSAVARSGELVSQHISYAARMIHDSVRLVDAEFLRSMVDWLELELLEGRLVGEPNPFNGRDLITTSLVNFPTYDLNFGWGRPLHFSFSLPSGSSGDGLVYILSAPQGGRSRHVAVSLREEHMTRLLEDEFFVQFLSELKTSDRHLKANATMHKHQANGA
ncbi:hypothetical protein O6H91_21G069500 [Diphasiastrum complanatum]|uniref:Uncharacterized protein n=1 Tax=Diphasiastrum complanatum TaxID=34168 RepID=A0ACC2ALN9_DIPCM|nr:hypothetical protein O6H91_21G069500 [Diphasiastrum complanatum]